MARRPLPRRLGPVLASVAAISCTVSALMVPLATTSLAGATSNAAPARLCVTLRLRAAPTVNAQDAPYETIRSTVASCASGAETVTLTQSLIGPFAQIGRHGRTWTIALVPGQSVVKTRYVPYSCCGTYGVNDKVLSSAGQVLAHRSTSFTFA
jgi:hypothetical protein